MFILLEKVLLFILLEKVLLLNVYIIVFQSTLQQFVIFDSNFLSLFFVVGLIFVHYQIAEVSIFFLQNWQLSR